MVSSEAYEEVPAGLSGALERLAREVEALKDDVAVRALVDARIAQFSELRENGSDSDWFSELCFCIMTANSAARLGIAIQSEVAEGLISLPEEELAERLIRKGHRFARARARYICQARKLGRLRETVERLGDDRRAREWLVENVLGLGYKEASHFLRNTGHLDVAILDRHILRLLAERGVIPQVPKSLTGRRYLHIEGLLGMLSRRLEMPLGVLDLYLWYMRTGEVLK